MRVRSWSLRVSRPHLVHKATASLQREMKVGTGIRQTARHQTRVKLHIVSLRLACVRSQGQSVLLLPESCMCAVLCHSHRGPWPVEEMIS